MPSTPFHLFCRCLVGLGALGLSGLHLPAQAEKADRDKPMQIEADSMRHDEGKQLTQFNGKVVAYKGTLVMRADRMQVQQDKQGKQVATLWAAPSERVFFRQKREVRDEYAEGEAETVIYDNQLDTVTLIQRAEVRLLRGTQLADQIQGQAIVFNNTTEVMTVDGKTQGPSASGLRDQRVRATLTPRQTPAGTLAPPAPSPGLRSSPGLATPSKP